MQCKKQTGERLVCTSIAYIYDYDGLGSLCAAVQSKSRHVKVLEILKSQMPSEYVK